MIVKFIDMVEDGKVAKAKADEKFQCLKLKRKNDI